MLSKTVIQVCRRCGSENIRLNGHADNGAQRAKCLECERTFILEPKGPRYDQAFKDQVVRACQDRMSLRGITRTFGVCYETVMEWTGKKIESLPALGDMLLPSEKGDVLEVDELWGFVGAKWQTCWLWIALCRRTRQVVAYTLGDRSQDSAIAFPARTHRCCGKQEGETNHVERRFGTLRARTSRLVRRAYSFSKSGERHADAIHLFITNYNLEIQANQQSV